MPLSAISKATADATYAAIGHDHEGTAILSTGETGGSKYLRENGDGTCSWQAIASGVSEGDSVSGATASRILIVDSSGQLDTGHGIQVTDSGEIVIESATAPQCRIGYDASNYTDVSVSSAGDLTITPSGGKVGIGASPAYPLDMTLSGAQGTTFRISATASNNNLISLYGASGIFAHYGINAQTPGIAAYNSDVALWAGGNEGIRIEEATGNAIFGNGSTSATPANRVLRGTSGSGTDIQGGTLYIAPGQSTGAGTPASVVIQSTSVGVTGSAQQTLADTLTVTDGDVIVNNATPTGLFYVGASGELLSDGPTWDGITLNLPGTGYARIVLDDSDGYDGTVFVNSGWFQNIINNKFWRIMYDGRTDTNCVTGINVIPDLSGPQFVVQATAVAQQRLQYDASNYADFSVSSVGDLVITPSGGTVVIAEATDLSFGTTMGTKIGTATSQKLGLWNATPIIQPTMAYAEAAFVENAGGTAVNDDSTFDGYTLRQVVAALRGIGLLA